MKKTMHARLVEALETCRASFCPNLSGPAEQPAPLVSRASTGGALAALAFMFSLSVLLSCNQDETAFGPQDGAAFESSINGQVTDRSGRPLSGALVTALPSGATTVSGADGKFTLSGLQSGEHRIAVAKDDYRDTTWATATRLGLKTTRDVGAMAMRFRYAMVKGVVVDSTGKAVDPSFNAAIAVEDQTATAHMVTDGKFTLARVEPGRVRLFTAIQGVGYGTLDTILEPDSTLQGVKLRIDRRGGTVIGQVVNADGSGISGAQVTTVGGALKTTTDSKGSFVITEVPGEGKVVVEVVNGDISTLVTGVRVGEGSKTDLSKIVVGTNVSTGSVLVRSGVAMAFETDSVVTLVADTASRDSTFRVLRYVWKAEGDAVWDTTATNVWVLNLARRRWDTGTHPVLVKALAVSSSGGIRESETGTITVTLLPPPDWTPPKATRRSPASRDMSVLWNVADYTLAWTVTDDRALESVWIEDSLVSVGDSGKCSRKVALAAGRHEYVLKARDKAGNIAWDTVVVTRMERDTVGPVVEIRSPKADSIYGESDTSAIVKWFLKDASGIDSIHVGGIRVTDSAGWVVRRVRLPLGDTLVRLRMVDRSGNESFDSVRLRRDLPPVMKLVNPTQDMTYPYETSSVIVVYQILDTSLIAKAWVNDYPVMKLVPGEAFVPVDIPDTGMTLRLRVLRRSGIVTTDSLRLSRAPRPNPALDTGLAGTDLDMESPELPSTVSYGVGGYSDQAAFPWSDGGSNGMADLSMSDSAHLNGSRSLRIFLDNYGGSGGNASQRIGVNLHADTGFVWALASDTISYWMTEVDYTTSSRWAWSQGLALVTSGGPVMIWNRCRTWGAGEHCGGIADHPESDYGFDDAKDSIAGTDGRKWKLYRVVLPDSLKGGKVKEVLFHAYQASWDGTRARNRFFLDRISGVQRSSRPVEVHDSTLASLVVSRGTLSPKFSPSTFAYSDTVYDSIVTITARAKDTVNTVVSINGAPVGKTNIETIRGETKNVRVVVRAADGDSLVYVLGIYRSTDVIVKSNFAALASFSSPYRAHLFVDSGVDTTGLRIHYTVDSTSPKGSSFPLANGWGVSFARPVRLIAAPWRNGVRVGPDQVFDWRMDSCVFTFNLPDSDAVYATDETNLAYKTKQNVYEYTRGASAAWALAPSTLSTGSSLRASFAIDGTDYPNFGIGFMVPWSPNDSATGGIVADMRGLKAVGFSLRFSPTTSSRNIKDYIRVEIQVDSALASADLYALNMAGVKYGWNVPVSQTSVTTKNVKLFVANSGYPTWATSTPSESRDFQFSIMKSLGFDIGCAAEACSDQQGTIEIDDIVYYYK